MGPACLYATREAFRPSGNMQYDCVSDGNVQAARLALILWLAFALKLWFVVEQPAGSCLWDYSRFQTLISKFDVWRHSFFMLDFGGETKKPTWIWSNEEFIGEIDQYAVKRKKQTPKPLVEVWQGAGGKRKFRGNGQTKASQTYPFQFGAAVVQLYNEHEASLKREACKWHRTVDERLASSDRAELVPTIVSQSRGGWLDASLDDVFTYLEGQPVCR